MSRLYFWLDLRELHVTSLQRPVSTAYIPNSCREKKRR